MKSLYALIVFAVAYARDIGYPLGDEFLDDPFMDSEWDDDSNFDDPEWDLDAGWEGQFSDFDNAEYPDFIPGVDQAGEAGQDVDIDVNGPCQADLQAHTECNHGRDKGVCLWMNAVDAIRWGNRFGGSDYYKPVSSECKASLIEFLSNASSHPFDYFHDLRAECQRDLETLCVNSTQEQTALACLRSNFEDLKEASCRDEVAQLNSWPSLDASWWSPSLWKDCAEERKSVCVNSTSNGLGDFRDCLDDHRESLGDKCHRSLFQSDLQAAPNPFLLRRDVSIKCAASMREFCSDVVHGDENQLFCLFRASKRHEDRFDPSCAEAVQGVVKVLESDYRMNVPVRKFCRRTINEFCPKEKVANDKNPQESDDVLQCLKRVYLYNEHRDRQHVDHSAWENYEETEACMHAVRQSVLIDSLDWEVDSSLHSNCFQDYHKLLHRIKIKDVTLRDQDSCQGETPHECLQSHFHDITDRECQRAVALHSQLSSLDQDFKPQLLAACALAMDRLDCSEFEASADHHIGKDGLVQCLYANINTISDAHCRGAIKHDYQLSERDFRLSYELSLVCTKDRAALCGSEEPGKVLKCMIDKIDSIADAECRKDVTRLSFVAVSEGEDVIEKSVCASDVAKHCQSTTGAHGSIHSCLLGKLGDLNRQCSDAVLNLHKSAASHEAMETLLNSACSPVLVNEACVHLIAPGSDSSVHEKLDCIERVRDQNAEPISHQCETQLTAVQALLAADYRTNPDLQRDCKTDVSILCPTESDRSSSASSFSTELIQCLVSQRARVRNANCKKQIIHQIYKMSENVMYVPNMRAVCGDDVKRFCPNVEPTNGQLHQCLRDNLESLSHDCQSQEFTVEQMEDLSAATRKACVPELASLCKQAASAPGGKLHCLWRNVDESSQKCERAVKQEMQGKIGNIWLDPALYTKCRVTANELLKAGKCPSHLTQLPVPLGGLIPLPANYTQAIAGEHVACLGNNRAAIQDRGCLKAVEDILRMETKDPVLLRFGVRTACSHELSVNGVCGEPSPFETVEQWKCLQDHMKSTSYDTALSSSCADTVKRMWRLALIDVKFNPDVAANCESEIKELCQVSGGRVLVCLQSKLMPSEGDASQASLLSEQCAAAVKRMPSAESADYEHPWNQMKAQFESAIDTPLGDDDDMLPIVENARLLKQQMDTTPSLSLTGPLAFVSLASLFAVVVAALYRVYRYKMNKGYMVIVNKS